MRVDRREDPRARRPVLPLIAAGTFVLFAIPAFAQNCPVRMAGPAGAPAPGTGAELLQLQQLQAFALQQQAMPQQAMPMMLAARQQDAARSEVRIAPSTCTMPAAALSARRAVREAGDRFASQRENARLRKEAFASRIATREAELQRRRDRAAAGR